MFITKSLFKEFLANQKLAFWHVQRDKSTYKAINEQLYGGMNGAEIGQSVEDAVMKLWEGKTVREVKMDGFYDFHRTYDRLSKEALAESPDVLYQCGFLIGDLFIKTDFLVKNEEGKYDIVEVKSVCNPYAAGDAVELTADLNYDVSFQAYVVKRVLGERFSGKTYLYFLNREYVKHGEIVPSEIIKTLDVSGMLFPDSEITKPIDAMRRDLYLREEAFDEKYPFDGRDYLCHFGRVPEKGTIFHIPRIGQSRAKLLQLFEAGKIRIKDLDEDDIAVL